MTLLDAAAIPSVFLTNSKVIFISSSMECAGHAFRCSFIFFCISQGYINPITSLSVPAVFSPESCRINPAYFRLARPICTQGGWIPSFSDSIQAFFNNDTLYFQRNPSVKVVTTLRASILKLGLIIYTIPHTVNKRRLR
jgi:hypothetical protein